jgi:hypothetical protein
VPRGIANAAKTVEAVNGVEYDRMTPGFDIEDEDATVVQEGRYKVVTPRAVSFTSYEVKFVEGIGRTDDAAVADKLRAEFGYRVIDTHKPMKTPMPIPEPLPETT